jgi:hypothetical protein
MQQRVELFAIAGGECGVERAGEIGRTFVVKALAFHPRVLVFSGAMSQSVTATTTALDT